MSYTKIDYLPAVNVRIVKLRIGGSENFHSFIYLFFSPGIGFFKNNIKLCKSRKIFNRFFLFCCNKLCLFFISIIIKFCGSLMYDFIFKPFNEMTKEDYKTVGFKSGLEIHQQLLTEKKLFCRCPAGKAPHG